MSNFKVGEYVVVETPVMVSNKPFIESKAYKIVGIYPDNIRFVIELNKGDYIPIDTQDYHHFVKNNYCLNLIPFDGVGYVTGDGYTFKKCSVRDTKLARLMYSKNIKEIKDGKIYLNCSITTS